MGKPNARKLLKRKKRKAKRNRRSRGPLVLAYRGWKYKTDDLIPWHLYAETAIHETFVVTGRRLTDREVQAAVERLVLEIRNGMPPILAERLESRKVVEGLEELIGYSIRRGWQELCQRAPDPGRDKLVGVLRTILGSIDIWSAGTPASRGYLEYLEGFLADLGVSVEKVSPDEVFLADFD